MSKLKLTKSTTLKGEVTINNTIAVSLTAEIKQGDASGGSYNRYIQNQDIYNANKVECRRQEAEFKEAMYTIEDEMDAE